MSVSTVCNTLQLQTTDNDNHVLNPISLNVRLLGNLPKHLHGKDVPVRITVHLLGEYAEHVQLEIHATPSDSSVVSSSDGHTLPEPPSVNAGDDIDDNCELPFLPLPQIFDPQRSTAWSGLVEEIETWLVTAHLDYNSHKYQLARDLFWVAFVAAYPTFPDGDWPIWDSTIDCEGEFIQGWMSSQSDAMNMELSDADHRQNMKREFQRIAGLCIRHIKST